VNRSEPISPDVQADGPAELLHPLFLISGLGGSLRGLAGGYAAIGYLAVSGRLQTALYGAFALLVFTAIGILLYWRRFSFHVGKSEIRIDSGIISRKQSSIPFDRIQDVDITQGPLARLLGLAKVKFETGAAGAGPGAPEAVLHCIALERAQEIRALIRGRAAGATVAPTAADSAEQPPIYAMDMKRLLLAGTFNFSLAIFAGLFGLSQTVGDVIGFDPFSRRFWAGIAERSGPFADFALAHGAGVIIAGFAVLLLIGVATGIMRTVMRDFGFRLDAASAGLRRRRGLLTKTDVTLPIKRAQAAIIGTGPVREHFGWSDLHVQNLAQDEGGKGDHSLAPLASGPEIDRILGELGWRPLPSSPDWRRVSKSYVTQVAIIAAPLLLVAAAQLAIFWPFALLYALALGAVILWRWLGWYRTAYVLDGDRLLIRHGWFRRRLVILPLRKIQSIDLSENVVTRWLGIVTLRFGVAGGRGFSSHFIPAIPTAIARQLRGELLVSVA
jgi:putative membrane protein